MNRPKKGHQKSSKRNQSQSKSNNSNSELQSTSNTISINNTGVTNSTSNTNSTILSSTPSSPFINSSSNISTGNININPFSLIGNNSNIISNQIHPTTSTNTNMITTQPSTNFGFIGDPNRQFSVLYSPNQLNSELDPNLSIVNNGGLIDITQQSQIPTQTFMTQNGEIISYPTNTTTNSSVQPNQTIVSHPTIIYPHGYQHQQSPQFQGYFQHAQTNNYIPNFYLYQPPPKPQQTNPQQQFRQNFPPQIQTISQPPHLSINQTNPKEKEHYNAKDHKEKEKETKSRNEEVSDSKMKPSSFSATKIMIGDWEYESTFQAEITAKFYFTKKQVVWELMRSGFKSKIVISFSDITALIISAVSDDQSSLTVEINKTPKFFREIDPQPKKNTNWISADDFTNQNATVFRRHTLHFRKQLLSKNIEKLQTSDLRLKKIIDAKTYSSEDIYLPGENPNHPDNQRYNSNYHSTSVSTSPPIINSPPTSDTKDDNNNNNKEFKDNGFNNSSPLVEGGIHDKLDPTTNPTGFLNHDHIKSEDSGLNEQNTSSNSINNNNNIVDKLYSLIPNNVSQLTSNNSPSITSVPIITVTNSGYPLPPYVAATYALNGSSIINNSNLTNSTNNNNNISSQQSTPIITGALSPSLTFNSNQLINSQNSINSSNSGINTITNINSNNNNTTTNININTTGNSNFSDVLHTFCSNDPQTITYEPTQIIAPQQLSPQHQYIVIQQPQSHVQSPQQFSPQFSPQQLSPQLLSTPQQTYITPINSSGYKQTQYHSPDRLQQATLTSNGTQFYQMANSQSLIPSPQLYPTSQQPIYLNPIPNQIINNGNIISSNQSFAINPYALNNNNGGNNNFNNNNFNNNNFNNNNFNNNNFNTQPNPNVVVSPQFLPQNFDINIVNSNLNSYYINNSNNSNNNNSRVRQNPNSGSMTEDEKKRLKKFKTLQDNNTNI